MLRLVKPRLTKRSKGVFGMVWYGMVWYGMVWYGMVWYGTLYLNTLTPTVKN